MKAPKEYYDSTQEVTKCVVCGIQKTNNCIWMSYGEKTNIVKCCNCVNQEIHEIRNKRKMIIAELPRCEILGCKRRATKIAGYRHSTVEICGHHLKKANRVLISYGFFGIMQSFSRDDIISLATTEE